jgi:hypothetical protein
MENSLDPNFAADCIVPDPAEYMRAYSRHRHLEECKQRTERSRLLQTLKEEVKTQKPTLTRLALAAGTIYLAIQSPWPEEGNLRC